MTLCQPLHCRYFSRACILQCPLALQTCLYAPVLNAMLTAALVHCLAQGMLRSGLWGCRRSSCHLRPTEGEPHPPEPPKGAILHTTLCCPALLRLPLSVVGAYLAARVLQVGFLNHSCDMQQQLLAHKNFGLLLTRPLLLDINQLILAQLLLFCACSPTCHASMLLPCLMCSCAVSPGPIPHSSFDNGLMTSWRGCAICRSAGEFQRIPRAGQEIVLCRCQRRVRGLARPGRALGRCGGQPAQRRGLPGALPLGSTRQGARLPLASTSAGPTACRSSPPSARQERLAAPTACIHMHACFTPFQHLGTDSSRAELICSVTARHTCAAITLSHRQLGACCLTAGILAGFDAAAPLHGPPPRGHGPAGLGTVLLDEVASASDHSPSQDRSSLGVYERESSAELAAQQARPSPYTRSFIPASARQRHAHRHGMLPHTQHRAPAPQQQQQQLHAPHGRMHAATRAWPQQPVVAQSSTARQHVSRGISASELAPADLPEERQLPVQPYQRRFQPASSQASSVTGGDDHRTREPGHLGQHPLHPAAQSSGRADLLHASHVAAQGSRAAPLDLASSGTQPGARHEGAGQHSSGIDGQSAQAGHVIR